MIHSSISEAIGNTPMIALARIHCGPSRILAKAEFMNPGGSMKDRPALWALRAAYADGRLKPEQTIVEMTSGNMGAGLAVVCAAAGNPFVAVMSEGNSPARRTALTTQGAEVVLVPQAVPNPGQVSGADIALAQNKAREIASARGAFLVDQFNSPACIAAHYESTDPEIWNDTNGQIDAFVMAVGSGASFIGVARYLKRCNPAIRCYAVEPEGAEVLTGGAVTKPHHILQGTGYGAKPPLWDDGLCDGSISVNDEDAQQWRVALGHLEGLNIGYSGAANVCAAARLIATGRLPKHAVVATLLCDSGLKYF